MREGMQANLGFDLTGALTGEMLELCACGRKVVSVDDLRRLVDIRVPPNQERMFWAIVERLSDEERSSLLKFATGTGTLPADIRNRRSFMLHRLPKIDVCPTASTCFFELQWPRYSSVETGLRLVRAALTYEGGFALA
jgi:hypothetical protein